MKDYLIDVHCHPAMKPFGKTFLKNNKRKHDLQNPQDKSNIWYKNKTTLFKKVIQSILTTTPFTQTDFTSVYRGGGKIVFISLYPMEKEFLKITRAKWLLRWLREEIKKFVNNLVTGLGRHRINHIVKMDQYYLDLKSEYEYYRKGQNENVLIDNQSCTYKIISNFKQFKDNEQNNPNFDNTIYLVITIEGCQALNCGLQASMNRSMNLMELINHVDELKDPNIWPHKPLFITFAHHFYNELCGHCKSLGFPANLILKQKKGMKKPFEPAGLEVMHKLLDNADDNRILIDIKHLSASARSQYYDELKKTYPEETIPIIISHGAVNGLDKNPHANNGAKSIKTAKGFLRADINFYDDEIVLIGKSNGLFGIQLDERRIAKKSILNALNRGLISRLRQLIAPKSYKKSLMRLLWRQIAHIAEVLNQANQNAWDIQSLGSDFDGMVNPLNGFWTFEELGDMKEYLIPIAEDYMIRNSSNFSKANQLVAKEIIEKFSFQNALSFLERNY